MKYALPFVMLAGLCLSGGALAGEASDASTPAAAPAPLLGSWVLDLSQMPTPAEYRPRSVTVTFADAGAGQWSTHFVIIGADGGVRDMTSLYERNGVAVPIAGDRMEADAVAVATPGPDIMVMALAKDGRPASTRVYMVSGDGASMTEQAVTYGDDGMPVIRSNRFSRLQP